MKTEIYSFYIDIGLEYDETSPAFQIAYQAYQDMIAGEDRPISDFLIYISNAIIRYGGKSEVGTAIMKGENIPEDWCGIYYEPFYIIPETAEKHKP